MFQQHVSKRVRMHQNQLCQCWFASLCPSTEFIQSKITPLFQCCFVNMVLSPCSCRRVCQFADDLEAAQLSFFFPHIAAPFLLLIFLGLEISRLKVAAQSRFPPGTRTSLLMWEKGSSTGTLSVERKGPDRKTEPTMLFHIMSYVDLITVWILHLCLCRIKANISCLRQIIISSHASFPFSLWLFRGQKYLKWHIRQVCRQVNMQSTVFSGLNQNQR